MIKILLDPGHGAGRAHNRGSVIGNEGDNNFHFAVVLQRHLNAVPKIQADLTRKKITDNPSLSRRGKMAEGYDYFISIHSNASNDPTVQGIEIYGDVNNSDVALMRALVDNISTGMKTRNRGIRYRLINGRILIQDRPPTGQSNYYSVLFNNLAKYGMLVEFVFHTNYEDCLKYVKEREKLARIFTETFCKVKGIQQGQAGPKVITGKMPIESKPSVTLEQMISWAKLRKAANWFITKAPDFYRIGKEKGVDPAILYAQSAKETNFFKFGGVLDSSFRNTCGMKTTEGGSNSDPKAHKRFANWEDSIAAQADHLLLYAGADGYPREKTHDPRHSPFIKGTAKTVEELGGKWAPSTSYGEEIVNMVREMQAIKVPTMDKEAFDKIGKKPIAVISIANEADLEAAKAIRDQLYPDYNAIITRSGRFDYADIDTRYIVAVGGRPGAHTGYKTHFVSGKNREETLKKAKRFKDEEVIYRV